MSDAKRIKELLRERVAELAQHLFPNGHRKGVHWRVGSIAGEDGNSFDICIAGAKAGLWGDWASGERNSRNPIDLWMAARNVDFPTALREAKQWLGVLDDPPRKSKSKTPKPFPTLDAAIACIERSLKKTATARYVYERDSAEVLKMVRFEGGVGRKQFRPFHQTADGWVIGDPPGKLPLYHRAKLLALRLNSANPIDKIVFAVEGEGCVEELETLELTATTAAHGAESPERTDWSDLAGKFVSILPDHDEVGRKFALKVAAILLQLSPQARVKIVDLPELPLKGDIVDWLEKRDAREPKEIRAELLALIEGAEEVTSAEAAYAARETPMKRDDFRAFMPSHQYIFAPTRDLWPASSVDARLPAIGKIRASSWLDRNRPVEAMTWAPAKPMIIEGWLINEGGWIERRGCSTFNLYRPPTIKPGDARKAGRWLDHVAMLYPHENDHIIRWLACRVQRPDVKINHAIYMAGAQGIGKDTLLYPVKRAVGMWNCTEILPPTLLGRFNGFVKSVLLCINEVHDLGEDLDRYALYERLKAYTAAPPDVIRVDEKHLREYQVPNICGVIITSNYKTGGLYLPADDRRTYVAWSDFKKDFIPEHYWRDIYEWFDQEGCRHVAAYLAKLDISDFDPKAPPPKTDAFWEMVESNRAPETSELADALDYLDNPDAITVADVVATRWTEVITSEFADYLQSRRNARGIPHRFEEVGYVAIRNPDHKGEGRWMIGKKRCVIYAKRTLSKRDQLIAARALIKKDRTND